MQNLLLNKPTPTHFLSQLIVDSTSTLCTHCISTLEKNSFSSYKCKKRKKVWAFAFEIEAFEEDGACSKTVLLHSERIPADWEKLVLMMVLTPNFPNALI